MQETYETQVQSLGQDDLLEEGMATHSSIFAWRIPWTEEPGGTVHTFQLESHLILTPALWRKIYHYFHFTDDITEEERIDILGPWSQLISDSAGILA